MIILCRNTYASNLSISKRWISSTTRIIEKESLIAAAYKPNIVEKNKYNVWEEKGIFEAKTTGDLPTFSMVLPPPNVTGKLHLGHALTCTIQDVIVRWNRSLGKNVLWLPGIDHAGIATQGVVEKHLKSTQDKTRQEIGREDFVKEIWNWKAQYGHTITTQLKTLGCSLDWSRQVFTMDPKHCSAVNTAFIKLFKKGLIYRKKALVNWCNQLKSTVSDIEVENVDINGPTVRVLPGYEKAVTFGLLYNFVYKIKDTDEEITVSTTMPETMLGDTAIAVHTDDDRYRHLVGQKAIHPFREDTIPIIFDDFVDMKFGSGAVKITPAHSKIDYDVAKRHNLPLLQVINEDGVMINSGTFDNIKRYDCRKLLIDKLEEMGALKSATPHQMTLPTCSRTGDVIDHLPKEQWFLSCSKLNKIAQDIVLRKEMIIQPDKFVSNWLNWTGDNRDWCISRQLWWGHRVPAYKCSVDNDVTWIAAIDEESAKLEAAKVLDSKPADITAVKDTDVLDTWFSSGIYPFAALGWEGTTDSDFKKFYPLDLMVTGHDILGFWVHRMVILSLELTGELPFKNVLLHGIICDNKGAKMSKSRGNVIDPIDVINGISLKDLERKSIDMYRTGVLNKGELEKALAYHKSNYSQNNGIPECGVDALRFTLLSHDIKSHNVNFDVAMCHANKLFCNKIWQSVKYLRMCFEKLKSVPYEKEINLKDLTNFDKWILSRMGYMVDYVHDGIETYDFHLATRALRTFIYNEVCDVYIEATKPAFNDLHSTKPFIHSHTLSAALNVSMRCLAPFMIYLTNELIPKIPVFERNIIHNFEDKENDYAFPKIEDFSQWKNKNVELEINTILNAVNLVRQIKGVYSITNKDKPAIRVNTTDLAFKSTIKSNNDVILNLTKCSNIHFDKAPEKRFLNGVLTDNIEIGVELIDNIDVLAARNRLNKRIKKIEDNLTKLESKSSRHHGSREVEKEKLMSELKQLQKLTV